MTMLSRVELQNPKMAQQQQNKEAQTKVHKWVPIVTSHVGHMTKFFVEIKCQLDATDDFYCRSDSLLNMFRAPLCPSSGAREYYTSGCCLSYLVLGFQVVGMVWS